MSAHIYFGIGGNVLTVVAVGYAVLYAIGLARGLDAVRLLGLAYLVGWGLLGLVVSYAMMTGIGFGLTVVLVAATVLVVACVVAGRFVPPVPAPPTPTPAGSLSRLGFVIGAAVIVVASISALVVSVQSTWTPDSDTIALWVPHASVIWRHGLWVGPSGWTSLYHPEYPPPSRRCTRSPSHQRAGFIRRSCPSSSACSASRSSGPCWRARPVRPARHRVPVNRAPRGRSRVLHEARLAPSRPAGRVLRLVGGSSCVLWFREGRIAWLALSVMLSAAGTLIKLEGATYALLLALIVLAGAALLRRRRIALSALALLLGLVAIEPWRLWLREHGLPFVDRLPRLELPRPSIHGRPDRTRALFGELCASRHVQAGQLVVILPLALLAILAALRRSPFLAAASGAWLVLAFAGLILVYWGGNSCRSRCRTRFRHPRFESRRRS